MSVYPSEYDAFDGSLRDVERGHLLYVDEKYFYGTVMVKSGLKAEGPLGPWDIGAVHVEYYVDSEGRVLEELPPEDLWRIGED